jgi:diaminohydroxyphosphoribosylaminopyrimidine deaminase/5-amino-6-(5-phosphoribosylamino)uracil reductase
MNDFDYMEMALALAEKGRGFTSPNPMVGAVVVKDGRVVGKGFHEAVGKAHAEVKAIDEAGPDAENATLYVTLEPCNHTGRTPPCTERILEAGIRRVVAAMEDPNPDVAGGGLAYLRKKGIAVDVGICRPETETLNECFIKYVRTKRPFVILKCASTLDGQIATRTGDARWVSGDASRRRVHRLRHAVDAVMVGIGTVCADDPSLTARLEDRSGRDPVRIILDTHLSVPEDAKVLQLVSDSDTIIVSGYAASEDKKARIEKNGVRVLHSPLKDELIDLLPLMDRLGAMGITSLLIEGGGRLTASALASGIVDKILIFYAPKLLGGNDGISVCMGKGAVSMNECIAVERTSVERFGEDVLIQGYIRSGG